MAQSVRHIDPPPPKPAQLARVMMRLKSITLLEHIDHPALVAHQQPVSRRLVLEHPVPGEPGANRRHHLAGRKGFATAYTVERFLFME